MLAVIVGLIFVALGLWGIAAWWPYFVIVLKGSVPPMIIVGGLLAIIAGITSLRDSLETKTVVKKDIEDK